MKIKFESNDELPLGEIINIPVCLIIAKSVFHENDKYYPQVHLKDCFLSISMKMKMILMLFC